MVTIPHNNEKATAISDNVDTLLPAECHGLGMLSARLHPDIPDSFFNSQRHEFRGDSRRCDHRYTLDLIWQVADSGGAGDPFNLCFIGINRYGFFAMLLVAALYLVAILFSVGRGADHAESG